MLVDTLFNNISYLGYLRSMRKRRRSLASSRELGGRWRHWESKLCSRRKHNDWILTSKSGLSSWPMDSQWIPPGKHSAHGGVRGGKGQRSEKVLKVQD